MLSSSTLAKHRATPLNPTLLRQVNRLLEQPQPATNMATNSSVVQAAQSVAARRPREDDEQTEFPLSTHPRLDMSDGGMDLSSVGISESHVGSPFASALASSDDYDNAIAANVHEASQPMDVDEMRDGESQRQVLDSVPLEDSLEQVATSTVSASVYTLSLVDCIRSHLLFACCS